MVGPFVFDGVRVYDAQFIKERVPTYFVGCSATILKIIEKKSIPIDQYFFASYSIKNGYKACSADYKSKRILIKAEWVESNVPGFGKTPIDDSAVQKKKTYLPAPAILYLGDDELFKNEKGEAIDIEIRGERHVDKIWFKAKHIENMLGLQDLSGTVCKTSSSYEEGVHYTSFLISCPDLVSTGDQIKFQSRDISMPTHGMGSYLNGIVVSRMAG